MTRKNWGYLVPIVLLLLWLVLLARNYLTDNFHVVLAGELYRSSQLAPTSLQAIIRNYHIQSVINLRGPHPNDAWYQQEIAIAEHNHVHHYDARLIAHGVPRKQNLRQLATFLKEVPRPILIHCRQGADRTGLVAAMGMILLQEASLHQASHQVSWFYNVLSPYSVGYEMLRNYFAWLQHSHHHHTKRNFLQWLQADNTLLMYRGVFLL